MQREPVLLIHGGAWAMPDDAVAAHERGIAKALDAGWAVLERDGSSLDAVQAAITVMEDDDTFDAGTGSFLTRDGRVQCDALMMNGANLRAGGVACVERLKNPIAAARLVLDHSPHVYFVGVGAERFATQHGMRLVENFDLVVPRERDRLMAFQRAEAAGALDTTFSGSEIPSAAEAYVSEQKDMAGLKPYPNKASVQEGGGFVDAAMEETGVDREVEEGLPAEFRVVDPTLHSHDTVGAVAVDRHGALAAGTSTGGTLSKAPGRVGDSSLIGCGCYADNASAAVSLTGWGEPIMKLVLGKWAVDRVAAGSSPEAAAADAIAYLHTRLGGHGGIIQMGPDGRIGLAHNTPRMAWGLARAGERAMGVQSPRG